MQYLPILHESLELKTEPLEHLGYLLLDIVLPTNRGKEKTSWVEEDWEADKLSSLDLTDSIWGMPNGTARFKKMFAIVGQPTFPFTQGHLVVKNLICI
jgi:hypothetical protein